MCRARNDCVTHKTAVKPCLAKADEGNHDHAGSRGTLLTWESPEKRLLTSPDASRAHWAEGLSATTSLKTPQPAIMSALSSSASVGAM